MYDGLYVYISTVYSLERAAGTIGLTQVSIMCVHTST